MVGQYLVYVSTLTSRTGCANKILIKDAGQGPFIVHDCRWCGTEHMFSLDERMLATTSGQRKDLYEWATRLDIDVVADDLV